ncbi:hypothetical protein VZT92_006634 [Zoarces viviparus]|uniref:Uncharacterized protein n=1 Tax=Zoarces viviparus TaxID=48416 RepID=A0AAW1FQF6_ZOAVI
MRCGVSFVPETVNCSLQSSVLPEQQKRAGPQHAGKRASLEIPITCVELLAMTFTAASHVNTAAELGAKSFCLLCLNGRKLTKESEKCVEGSGKVTWRVGLLQ